MQHILSYFVGCRVYFLIAHFLIARGGAVPEEEAKRTLTNLTLPDFALHPDVQEDGRAAAQAPLPPLGPLEDAPPEDEGQGKCENDEEEWVDEDAWIAEGRDEGEDGCERGRLVTQQII